MTVGGQRLTCGGMFGYCDKCYLFLDMIHENIMLSCIKDRLGYSAERERKSHHT